MADALYEQLQSLVKALEAGNYDGRPTTLVEGQPLVVSFFDWDLEKEALDDYYRNNPTAVPVYPVEDKCECGGFKTYGARKGEYGHSDWCPWSPK